jgi:cellulose synthase (UDP-forming)
LRENWRRSRRTVPAGSHLPEPPSDEEKYSYFDPPRRWPFVWLFLSQACLIWAYVHVMTHSLDTALGLIPLTVMLPPLFVNFWLRVRPHRLSLEDHVIIVEGWRYSRSAYPSVDIFLPTCGEDRDVLANTFRYVSELDWQGALGVYVLDDADLEWVSELAASFGFHYLVRPNRGEWKKAGNLIHAFGLTSGDFIAVFDADFAPRPDFLWDTVPYMADPSTGVVQTAQYFDVDGRVNYFARYSGALQELFFRWIQPARDTCEAAICAGTNVVYRRAAVAAAGGFAQVPLGEDVHSGVKLWVANFRTRYVPIVLAKGLAPDSWSALTNQQYRWCRSSMLLMISDFFRQAPFSRRQRVCFWAAFLYYISSATLLITSALPTLVILWAFPSEITPSNYWPLIPSVVAQLFVFRLTARGWRPTIYRVCMVNTFCHVLAVADAFRDRVQAWVPTGAARTVGRGSVPERAARLGRTWLVLVQAALWVGLARHLHSGAANPWSLWPAVVLGAFQLYLLAPLLITLGPDGRAGAAVRTARPARLTVPKRTVAHPIGDPSRGHPQLAHHLHLPAVGVLPTVSDREHVPEFQGASA